LPTSFLYVRLTLEFAGICSDQLCSITIRCPSYINELIFVTELRYNFLERKCLDEHSTRENKNSLITVTILDTIYCPVYSCLLFKTKSFGNSNLSPDISNNTNLESYWCCLWCRDTENNSIYWSHMSRFHLKTGTESSLRNAMF
jgi:hypothetical protein